MSIGSNIMAARKAAGLTPEQTQAFAAAATAVGHSFDQPVYGADGKVDAQLADTEEPVCSRT